MYLKFTVAKHIVFTNLSIAREIVGGEGGAEERASLSGKILKAGTVYKHIRKRYLKESRQLHSATVQTDIRSTLQEKL